MKSLSARMDRDIRISATLPAGPIGERMWNCMKTIAFLDGRLGMEIGRYLAGRSELSGVLLHPPASRRYVSPADFDGSGVPVWTWPDGYDEAVAARPECLLSVCFGYRIPSSWLSVPAWGAVNLHPGYLPYNRGRAASAWPLIDGSPAGATLHLMTEDFDVGPIIARELVPTYPEDTGDTVALRIESAALVLFRNSWSGIREIEPLPQDDSAATYHSRSDINSIILDPSDLELLDRMRARTYGGGGITFELDGRRYEVAVDIRLSRSHP